MRIVSLLPSTTEILFAIGAGDDVVGVTFECDYPPEAQRKRIVSNTTLPPGLTPSEIDNFVRTRMASGEELYTLDAGALAELDADLVVTQDLCAVCAVAVADVDDALAHLGCRAEVLTVDPGRLTEVVDSIAVIGHAVGRAEAADALVTELRSRLEAVRAAVAGRPQPRVAMLEWTDPLFCGGHWVPDLVEAAGGVVALGRFGTPSVEITAQDVHRSEPDLIVAAPCGYRLDDAAKLTNDLLATGTLPDVEVWAVDADALIVRPGPRVVDGVETLAGILHPDAVPLAAGTATRLQ